MDFARKCRDYALDVTIFLINGIKLSGVIETVTDDNTACTLKRDGVTQLVMRHAIATIMPQNAIPFDEFDRVDSIAGQEA